jgi:hypothetical protein
VAASKSHRRPHRPAYASASSAQEQLLRFQRSSSLWASLLVIQGDKNNYGATMRKRLTKVEQHSADSDAINAKTINNRSPIHVSLFVF